MVSHGDENRLLDAAEELFYARGYQAVGMDALREASGLPLKRIYSLFPGKEAIVVAMLNRRDERWNACLSERVAEETDPQRQVLAIFDWISTLLEGEGFRGCAWINVFGELGGISPDVAEAVRGHKERFRNYIDEIVGAKGEPQGVSDAIYLLAEGCMVTAGIFGTGKAIVQAKEVAARLLNTINDS